MTVRPKRRPAPPCANTRRTNIRENARRAPAALIGLAGAAICFGACNQLIGLSDEAVLTSSDGGSTLDGSNNAGCAVEGMAEPMAVGETNCDGTRRLTCGENGALDVFQCESAQHCQLATGPECAVCLPNEYRCDENALSVCNETGTGFEQQTVCTDAPCNAEAGACTTDACLADQKRCQGDTLEVCNADRTAFVLLEQCGEGLCDPEQLECAECIGSACAEPCPTPAPTNPETTYACQGGEWVITGCPANYLHCDTDLANGCETDGAQLEHCRSCDNTCSFDCGATDCDDLNAVFAGWYHSCGITSSGAVYCWGKNSSGQLGDGSKEDHNEPTLISGLTGAKYIAGGELHTCVIVGASGAVRCFGSNADGQLGAGSIGESLTPVAAGSLTGVTSLDAGRAHTCAALADGHVWCWGQQAEGRLGNALTTTAAVQAPVQALLPGDMEFTDAVQVVTGEAHTCVRHETGSVSCFGDNSVGQLGTGTEGSPQAYAQAVSGLSDVTQLAAGAFHTCALTDEGIYCWGSNYSKELGQASEDIHPTPALVPNSAQASLVVAGYSSTCAIIENGTLACWGSNESGERGEAPSAASHEWTLLDSLNVARVTSHGVGHVCILTNSGEGYCFGLGTGGQLGNRVYDSTHLPQLLTLQP